MSETDQRASVEGSGYRNSWYGGVDATEVADMLSNGWEAGVKDIEGLDGLTSDLADRVELVRDVAGVFPVVPAYLAGSPDSMLNVQTAPRENTKRLTLVLNGSYNCGVDGEKVLEYAKHVMRMVAWLQAERIDTAVYICFPINFNDQKSKAIYLTKLQGSDQVLQPERIAAALHTAFFRRGWFSVLEYEYHGMIAEGKKYLPGSKDCTWSYGRSTEPPLNVVAKLLGDDENSIVLMPKPGYGDPEKAIREAINLKLRRD
jgi:hypothetical protein